MKSITVRDPAGLLEADTLRELSTELAEDLGPLLSPRFHGSLSRRAVTAVTQ